MKKTRFSYINGASKKLIALISALAIIIGCAAAMTAPVTAEDDGVDWFLNRSKKTTYEEYVEHGAVDKYGDFDDSGHGDMVDVLSAYLVASGIIEPTNCLYDDPDTIAWNMRSHGRFEPPCDEWRRLHGQPVQNHDWVDCLYEPMALYYRICAGTDNPLSGPEDPRATTTTEETTTTTEPTTTEEAIDWNSVPIDPDYFPTWPKVPKPSWKHADEKEIAQLIVKKINDIRMAAGLDPLIQLTKYSKVSEYRCRQLYYDFSHNFNDYMEALCAYSYGDAYFTVLNTYKAYLPSGDGNYLSGECCGGGQGDLDNAEQIAESCVAGYNYPNSKHWEMLMDKTAKFVGVGCMITTTGNCINCINFLSTDKYE